MSITSMLTEHDKQIDLASQLPPELFRYVAVALSLLNQQESTDIQAELKEKREIRRLQPLQAIKRMAAVLVEKNSEFAYQLFIDPQNREVTAAAAAEGYRAYAGFDGIVQLETDVIILEKNISPPEIIEALESSLGLTLKDENVENSGRWREYQITPHISVVIKPFRFHQYGHQIYFRIRDNDAGDFAARKEREEKNRVETAELARLADLKKNQLTLLASITGSPNALAQKLENYPSLEELGAGFALEVFNGSEPIAEWAVSSNELLRLFISSGAYRAPKYHPLRWEEGFKRFTVTAHLEEKSTEFATVDQDAANQLPSIMTGALTVPDLRVSKITITPSPEFMKRIVNSRETQLRGLNREFLKDLLLTNKSFSLEDLIGRVESDHAYQSLKLSKEHARLKMEEFMNTLVPPDFIQLMEDKCAESRKPVNVSIAHRSDEEGNPLSDSRWSQEILLKFAYFEARAKIIGTITTLPDGNPQVQYSFRGVSQ
jgi:hypothetical protein